MCEVRKQAMVCMALAVITAAMVSGAARAEDKRIAVVNVSDVFGRYDRVKDVQDKLQKEYEPQQKKIQAKERDLKLWKDRIENDAVLKDPKTDPGLFADQLKLQQAAFDFQIEYNSLLKDVEERRKNEMKLVLSDIRKAISTIGKQEKFDLVLRAPEYTGEFDMEKAAGKKGADEAVSAAELVRRFRDNPVLFFASGVDITEKVIEMLNTDYKAKGK